MVKILRWIPTGSSTKSSIYKMCFLFSWPTLNYCSKFWPGSWGNPAQNFQLYVWMHLPGKYHGHILAWILGFQAFLIGQFSSGVWLPSKKVLNLISRPGVMAPKKRNSGGGNQVVPAFKKSRTLDDYTLAQSQAQWLPAVRQSIALFKEWTSCPECFV